MEIEESLTAKREETQSMESREFRFSDQDAAAIMKIILDRSSAASTTTEKPNATHNATAMASQNTDNKHGVLQNEKIIQSSSLGLYMTLQGLKKQYMDLTRKIGGRCRVDQGALFLGVSAEQILEAMMIGGREKGDDESLSCDKDKLYPIKAQVLGKEQVVEYVSDSYLDDAVHWIKNQLESCEQGFMPFSGIVNSLPFSSGLSSVENPPSVWLQLLQDRFENTGISVRELDSGSCVLLIDSFWKLFCVRVFGTLAAMTKKTSLTYLCQEHSWEVAWTVDALLHPPVDLKHLIPPGEIQGSDYYIPNAFKQWQHKIVKDSFLFHGFVPVKSLCSEADLSQTQLIRLLEQEFGDDVFVAENKYVVISRERVISPWMALIQEAEHAKTFCEFSVSLELLASSGNENNNARQQFMENCLFSQSWTKSGVVSVTKDGNALFMSGPMVDTLVKIHLPPVIATFAKKQASSLSETNTELSEILEDQSILMPPVDTFVDMVRAHYPNIGEEEYVSISKGGGEDSRSETCLADLCRRCFLNSDEIRQRFALGIQKEFERLLRQRSAGAIHEASLSNQVTVDIQSSTTDEIIVPFEDPACFSAACFRIQSFIKFYDYAVKNNMTSVKVLEEEILLRCCADFTRRVHQYCLSKHEDLPAFVFFFRNAEDINLRLPVYCSVIDIAAPNFGPRIELACSPDPESGKDRDPMAVIRDLLPGAIGEALERQYDLCTLPQKSLKEFQAHVEEHTMTICGLPFKKMDKKAEKNFLAERRQALRSRLEQTQDPLSVLQLTVMILYQAVKNHFVAGALLTGPILSMLIQERKIPKPVGERMNLLASQIHCGGNKPPDRLLVESVRGFGLCKDITKHVIVS